MLNIPNLKLNTEQHKMPSEIDDDSASIINLDSDEDLVSQINRKSIVRRYNEKGEIIEGDGAGSGLGPAAGGLDVMGLLNNLIRVYFREKFVAPDNDED